MVFHTMIMQLPPSLRVIGGTTFLLSLAAAPLALKSKSLSQSVSHSVSQSVSRKHCSAQ